MSKTKKVKEPKKDDEQVEVVLVALPKKYKGKIPRAVIRAAVRKVVGERRKREAAEAAVS